MLQSQEQLQSLLSQLAENARETLYTPREQFEEKKAKTSQTEFDKNLKAGHILVWGIVVFGMVCVIERTAQSTDSGKLECDTLFKPC